MISQTGVFAHFKNGGDGQGAFVTFINPCSSGSGVDATSLCSNNHVFLVPKSPGSEPTDREIGGEV